MTKELFKKFTWILEDDIREVSNLLRTNNLSGFLATEGSEHFGGTEVRKLESDWVSFEGVNFAVSFNSWTSGLEASLQSLNLPLGSEVITTPWTMSATTAVIVNSGLIPRFVDIRMEDFNIDVHKVEAAISSNTSAILAVDIFGYPCDSPSLREICNQFDLKLVIDSAQTPLARISGHKPSKFADVSGYSFNRHKHLQCGEGGIAVTNHPQIHKNLTALRNHAEIGYPNQSKPLQGRNLRFGEIEANLIRKQLSRISYLVDCRRRAAKSLMSILKDTFLEFPEVQFNIDHDYYILGMKLPIDYGSSRRKALTNSLNAKEIPGVLEKYVVTHRLDSFKDYHTGKLMNAESLQDQIFFGIYMCGVDWTDKAIEFTADSIKKSLN